MAEKLADTMKMSVIMTEQLRNDIRALAARDGRSDTKYAAKVLQEHVEREKRKALAS